MKKKRIVFFISSLSLVLALTAISQVIPKSSHSSLPAQYAHASWNYSYKDLDELADNSDLIAIVKVIGVNKEFTQDRIDFTVYNAIVEESIFNSQDNQNITFYMTGVNNKTKHIEIIDDPLPNKDDSYLIFARKNTNGIYSIIGGPQGRLLYKDNKLNSLNYITDRVDKNNIDIKDADFDTIKAKLKEHKKQ